jgi:hypothetical protein
VIPTAKHTLRALLALCACAVLVTLLLALPAQAATRSTADAPCWKALLNDWYKPPIDKLYPIPCYRQAINHLPTDVEVYSSAREDILRALAVAIAHSKGAPPPPTPTGSTVVTTTTTPAGHTTVTTTTTTPGRDPQSGPIPTAISNSSPGGATSFPLPLIILGGLALFLIAAGAVGLIVRRMQDRGPGTS